MSELLHMAAPAGQVRCGLALMAVFLCSCGGGDESGGGTGPPPAPATYTVGGAVTGLVGSLTLQNNGGDSLTLTANGAFTFGTRLNSGSSYAVSVSSQPSGPDCVVGDGSGAANSNVTNIAVTCTTSAESRYLPLYASRSGTGSPLGLYVLGTKLIDRAPVRVTPDDIRLVALIPELTVGANANVTRARPAQLIYVTNGVAGGDHLWRLDLDGASDLVPRQLTSLTMQGPDVPVPRTLCQVKPVLRRLNDPRSAFLLVTVSDDPSTSCFGGPLLQFLVNVTDTATAAPIAVPHPQGTIEPVYRPDGAMAGLVFTANDGQSVEFSPDETFSRSSTLVGALGIFGALREISLSPWTQLQGVQSRLVITFADNESHFYRIDPSGQAALLRSSAVMDGAVVLGDDIFMQERDVLTSPMTLLVRRVPIDGTTSTIVRSVPDDNFCGSEGVAGILGSGLYMLKACGIPSGGYETTLHRESLTPGGTSGLLATYAGTIASGQVFPETNALLMSMSYGVAPSPAPTFRYETEILGPAGNVLQARSRSFFPLLNGNPAEGMLQIRDISSVGMGGGGLYKLTLSASGLPTLIRLNDPNGTPATTPVDTGYVWGHQVAPQRAFVIQETSAGSTSFAIDYSRNLVIPVSVPGADLLLITNDGAP